jgi:hypothetical protein
VVMMNAYSACVSQRVGRYIRLTLNFLYFINGVAMGTEEQKKERRGEERRRKGMSSIYT